jgi:hypothetical protein
VTVWYEQLREQYRPDRLEVLLIGESPPDPGANERRFFYAPTLRIDNLYRGVAQGLYGDYPAVDLTDKPAVLRRLQTDGFWLIDAVDQPVNHLPPGPRRASITAAVPQLVARCRELAPRRGVIICHRVVYQLTAPACARPACGCSMTSRCCSRSATGGPSSLLGSAGRSPELGRLSVRRAIGARRAASDPRGRQVWIPQPADTRMAAR